MPAIHRTLLVAARHRSPRLLRPWAPRRLISSSRFRAQRDSQIWRPDFTTTGYSNSYEVGAPTVGPLAQAAKHGAPRLTPSALKEHLDKFVVGQDRAKKVTSVAIYNHYQRIREIQRQDDEEVERRAQEERRLLAERERDSHPVENEFPGHVDTVDLDYRSWTPMVDQPELGSVPLSSHLSDQTVIEKSNVLLLGPSGVGKTYILSTLARVLEVPFATVDCSALTQAGYIGTDIESSIERLLLAAGNSVQKCETGIIFFDEVDKLAKPAVMTHGRDVSGEGVQQGLLKMIEGTTVTVNAKSDRTSKTESSPSRVRDRAGREATSGSPPASGKSEQCTIDTRNILFVFAGAFVGLEKIIASRLSSGSSIGFGAQLKSEPPSPSYSSSSSSSPTPPNPLDAVLPTDLQTYGLIPELLGRIPVITSLHPLTQSQLVSILTEPRNSLVKQYTALFNTYGIQLRFTTPALHAIAARALSSSNPSKSSSSLSSSTSPSSTPSGIGARGLRATLESVLGEIMFWGPGSGIRFCLVDEAFVRAGETSSSSPPSSDREREKDLPPCWSRGQGRLFEDAYEKEEEAYRRRERGEREDEQGVVHDVQSFERYREVGRSGM